MTFTGDKYPEPEHCYVARRIDAAHYALFDTVTGEQVSDTFVCRTATCACHDEQKVA